MRVVVLAAWQDRIGRTGLALDYPAVCQRVRDHDARRHVVRCCRHRQLAIHDIAHEGHLLARRDLQAATDPRDLEPIVLARIAGDVLIAVIELLHVLLEPRLTQPRRHLLGIPDDRVGEPGSGIGGRTPGWIPARIAALERHRRLMLVDQETAVVAHQADRDVEGRCGRDALVALPLLHQRSAGGGIGQHRAIDWPCRSRRRLRRHCGRCQRRDAPCQRRLERQAACENERQTAVRGDPHRPVAHRC